MTTCEVIRVDFAGKKVLGRDLLEEENPDSNEEKEKANYFAELIEQDMTTTIVNTRDHIVKVPEHLLGMEELHLSWSYRYNLPDFEFDDQSVRGSLSFNGKPSYVIVPWESVTGIFHSKDQSKLVMWVPATLFDQNDEESGGVSDEDSSRQVVGTGFKARARKAILSKVARFLGRRKQD